MSIDMERIAFIKKAIELFAPNGYEKQRTEDGLLIKAIANTRFTINEPRKWQEAPIESLLRGDNIIVQAPVGKGKSTIFTNVIAKTQGLAYIIVPTIALGYDMLHHLEKAGAKAFMWNSYAIAKEKAEFTENIENYHAVILAPESIKSVPKYHNVPLLVVDEAHHIVQSATYRTAFMDIGSFAHTIKPKSVGLFSATFKDNMLHSIEKMFYGFNFKQYRDKNPDRENIKYHTYQKTATKEDIENILSKTKGSAIIYTFTKNAVDNIYLQIKGIASQLGFEVLRYHSEVTNKQEAISIFQKKRALVIGTSAFGEGINKPDVETIIRIGMPMNVLQLVQEAGRAMRDQSLGDGHYHLFTSIGDKQMYDGLKIDINLAKRIYHKLHQDSHEKYKYVSFLTESKILNVLSNCKAISCFEQNKVHYDIEFLKTKTAILNSRLEDKFGIVELMRKKQWTMIEMEDFIDKPVGALQKAKKAGMLTYIPPSKNILYKRNTAEMGEDTIRHIESLNQEVDRDKEVITQFILSSEPKKWLNEYFEKGE